MITVDTLITFLENALNDKYTVRKYSDLGFICFSEMFKYKYYVEAWVSNKSVKISACKKETFKDIFFTIDAEKLDIDCKFYIKNYPIENFLNSTKRLYLLGLKLIQKYY